MITSEENMKAAFSKWWEESGGGPVSLEVNARHTWKSAWQAALQQESEAGAVEEVAVNAVRECANETDMRNAILALIPQDGRTQLEEFGMKVAEAIRYRVSDGRNIEPDDFRSIVTNLISVPPLSSEGGKK